ncbi:unnamed protein product, partial [marine sediment metagenome]
QAEKYNKTTFAQGKRKKVVCSIQNLIKDDDD